MNNKEDIRGYQSEYLRMIEFGKGQYVEGTKIYTGFIRIDKHKLYLWDGEDNLNTYIPLERIAQVRRRYSQLEVVIVLSASHRFIAKISAKKSIQLRLLKHLVQRLSLKKSFLRPVWKTTPYFR